MSDTDWRAHARRLAEFLASEGLDDTWTEVFAQVPRHKFVDVEGLNDDAPSERALAKAYADDVIVTRWRTADGERVPTSSASQPAIMATMLRLLDVETHNRVLEIGTGPGYNAGLLCARLGDDRVTSLDIQPDVVEEAVEHLSRLGYHPHIEVADGRLGCPSRAPFDRVIATCGLSRIPPQWLSQLAHGARVVAPMNFGGALAVLDRRADGSLHGHLSAEAGFFMELQDSQAAGRSVPTGQQRELHTTIDPENLANLDFRLWLELTVQADTHIGYRAGRLPSARISTPKTIIDVEVGEPTRVYERGEPLWPSIEHAFRIWNDNGRPNRTELGMTVTADRQWVWLTNSTTYWDI